MPSPGHSSKPPEREKRPAMTQDDRTDETPADDLTFNRSFEGGPGELVRLSPLVRRMVAGNSGPMTFTGTCTYVVGTGEVAIIDPGPDLAKHIAALLAALQNETIATIVVTHTHRDHSPAANTLKAATGARIIGCAPYTPPVLREDDAMPQLTRRMISTMRPNKSCKRARSSRARDFRSTPSQRRAIRKITWPLPSPRKPRCFRRSRHGLVDIGHRAAGRYLARLLKSLEKLRLRDDKVYWPGHGGPVTEPQRFVRALGHHRRQREQAILSRLAAGNRQIRPSSAMSIRGLAPALHGAAALSVLAHLEDLVARGQVRAHGPLSLAAAFELK